MTTTNHPSGLPEQEPTSPTAVVLCGDESWVNTAIGWESLTKWLGAWGDLRDFAAEKGGATLVNLADLPDLPARLSEAQKGAIRSVTVTAPKPADPTGGDPVVRASLRAFVDYKKCIFFRAQDGWWSRECGSERGMWGTAELAEIGRLSAQTIAELMGGEGNE